MTELPTRPSLPPIPDNQAKGFTGRAVAFLKRDIKSFLPGRNNNGDRIVHDPIASEQSVAVTPADTPVESLVDLNKLPDMAFRREVLDWRDNFHANVTTTVSRLQGTFVDQIHIELGSTSLYRKLITRPTDGVLQDLFVSIVRLPLIMAVRQEEAKLNACAKKWELFGKADLVFDVRRLNAECVSLHDVGFKPSNKNLILLRLHTLMLGPAGVAEHFRDQALHLSRILLEAKET